MSSAKSDFTQGNILDDTKQIGPLIGGATVVFAIIAAVLFVVINIVGDLTLVAGLHMDAAGAAIATVFGIILNAVYYWIYYGRKKKAVE